VSFVKSLLFHSGAWERVFFSLRRFEKSVPFSREGGCEKTTFSWNERVRFTNHPAKSFQRTYDENECPGMISNNKKDCKSFDMLRDSSDGIEIKNKLL